MRVEVIHEVVNPLTSCYVTPASKMGYQAVVFFFLVKFMKLSLSKFLYFSP